MLFLSDLADYTKNLREDPRLAFLFEDTEGYDDPLEGPRATILGTAQKIDDEAELNVLLARFLRRHANAELYAGFRDFHLFCVRVERAQLVAGFGRIAWLDVASFMPPAGECAKLAAAEPDIIEHMNEDHGDAVQLMAGQALKQRGLEQPSAQSSEGWQLTGIDPDGADLRRGNKVLRLDFEKPASDAESCRVELVRLTKQARRAAE